MIFHAATTISLLLAVVGFISFYPISFPGSIYLVKFLFIVAAVFVFTLFVKLKLKVTNLWSGYFFILFSLCFSMIYSSPATWLTFGSMVFVIAILLPKNILASAGGTFENILFWIFIPGLILHFLFIAGVDIPHFIVSVPHKEIYGYYYKAYIFNAELSHVNFSSEFGRFSSVFDEPGIVGTISGLVLVYRGLNFSSLKSVVFLVAGLASFSIAFFAIVLIGFIMNWKEYKKSLMVIVSLLCFLFLIVIPGVKSSDISQESLFYRHVIVRLINPESINNRESECFKVKMNDFVNSDSLLFGKGPGSVAHTGCDVSSPSVLIYEYGFLGGGLIIIYNFIIFVILNKKLTGAFFSSQFILVFFVPFLASFYQRPYVFHIGMLCLYLIYINSTNRDGLQG
ncbi:hypothetical protein [Shewanella indica]|uniref:hypothetical protein n=1 Tax=Shewanella indica TaxID=768528 RepID=UPI00399C4650